MIGKIVRRIKLLSGDRRWWGFYLQRRFLKPTVRNRLATRVASKHRPPFQFLAQREDAKANSLSLSESGIFMLGELLDTQACEELRSYFCGLNVFDPYRTDGKRFLPTDQDGRHPDSHIAHHEALDILRAPYLIDLVNDPRILDIVSDFLGCKPTVGYMAAWWSYHTEKGAQQAEFFHRDVDDWKFVKLFVYLTDVGVDSGPHIYVKNSANDEKLTEIRRFTDDEVYAAFGVENVLTMVAKAGQGFLEDTFGIHKGQPVAKGVRLIFQAVYALSPLPYGPKAPVITRVELGRPNLDAWINRVYVQ